MVPEYDSFPNITLDEFAFLVAAFASLDTVLSVNLTTLLTLTNPETHHHI